MPKAFAELIGSPVAHSKSPLIHNFWLQALNIDAEYRAFEVPSSGLAEYLAIRRSSPGWFGCNVTMPHKQTIMPMLDTLSEAACAVGAANLVCRGDDGRLVGSNTDVSGVAACLQDVELSRRTILIVGAGGAARAAIHAVLRRAQDCRLILMNRSLDRAACLASDFGIAVELLPLGPFPPADLLVNASPLGMKACSWPILDLNRLPGSATVFDMVYVPLETHLLRAARERGLKRIDGLDMLIHQAREAFSLLYGAAPPPSATIDLIRDQLIS